MKFGAEMSPILNTKKYLFTQLQKKNTHFYHISPFSSNVMDLLETLQGNSFKYPSGSFELDVLSFASFCCLFFFFFFLKKKN